MANISSPLPYLNKRDYGLLPEIKSQFFTNRLNAAKNLYRKDLVCHFGCVNAVEFSKNGELLVSGGDDRRVMLWQFGKAIMDYGRPEPMKSTHQSNIFCLGITSDNQKIYSGGNDDMVIVHDIESRSPLEILQHQRAVCSLSVDPFDDRVLVTAGNDGRLLLFDTRRSVHETMIIARSRKAYHGVMFHPQQCGLVVCANARDGVALMDLRTLKAPLIRYTSHSGAVQNSMSVRFDACGHHILALRRRQSPILYSLQSPEPVAEFYHQDYYNSCTMKSCSFGGQNDEYVMSGSDDFNLYVWKIPDLPDKGSNKNEYMVVESPHIILYGHRSIVNQVRYNPHYCLIASSGVEKIIKVWSGLEFPKMRGSLLEEAQGSENPREIYTHEDYVSLVHHSGQYISHNYAEQSTSEDPRMMAFFDSLVQRELECLAEETDSLDGSSSGASTQHNSDSDSSDDNQFIVDDNVRWSLPPKRPSTNGARSQRCPNRLARLVASRHTKNMRLQQKRGSARRAQQSRANKPSTSKGVSGSSTKGKRTPARRTRVPRRALPHGPARTRRSAPSSERTDSDEPAHCLFRNSGRIIRQLRRRMNPSRTVNKRKKIPNFKISSRRRGSEQYETVIYDFAQELDGDGSYIMHQPSTSSGYRGQNTPVLFRIAEVDSDDEQPVASRPISPRHNGNNLVSIVPTPINGSRDSVGDSLRADSPERDSTSPTPQENRRNLRRVRRNGRLSLQRSDSSESPERAGTSTERLPHVGFNRTVARLMNETNESELESSCSTEGSTWPAPETMGTPDSGVGTVAGSSTRHQPDNDLSDDAEYQALKFRQRVKKARRNYRNHMDSDSN